MQRISERSNGRKGTVFVMVVILVAAGMAFSSFALLTTPRVPPASVASETLGSFQTYQQLQQFIAANARSAQQYGNGYGGVMGGIDQFGMVATMTAASTATAMAAAPIPPSFTTTNVQVQGVDELDTVKTDGTYLYVATNQAVFIIRAYPPNSSSVVSTIGLQNANVIGISVAPDRIVVIDQGYQNASYVDLRLYDVSSPATPHLLKIVSVEGNYVAARISQGYLYAVIQQPSYQFDSNGNASGALPTVVKNGTPTDLQPSSVYYTPNRSQISFYTMVVSMSMSSGADRSVAVLTGPASTVYASTSNIYVVYSNYYSYYADNIPGNVFGGPAIPTMVIAQPQNSTIFRVAYSAGGIAVKAAGSVPGTVLNQFSLDEYKGNFRVATSRLVLSNDSSYRSDDVYVLDQNLTQVAALRNIAPGENLYAVRFVGDMGYVVTFEQVDPLFAISFKDVANPVIISALKVSGFSDYLHPFGSGYLIGVGKDAMASSTGNFAWYLGLKLSLFHVLDNGTSAEVARYLIGDRGTDSPVLSDHLAFTLDPAKGTMVIPVLLTKVNGYQTGSSVDYPPYGEYVWQGVYVFNVTQTGFTLLGTVSQIPQGQTVQDYQSSGNQIYRSVIIGNDLYTISQNEVMVSDLSHFSTLATISLTQV